MASFAPRSDSVCQCLCALRQSVGELTLVSILPAFLKANFFVPLSRCHNYFKNWSCLWVQGYLNFRFSSPGSNLDHFAVVFVVSVFVAGSQHCREQAHTRYVRNEQAMCEVQLEGYLPSWLCVLVRKPSERAGEHKRIQQFWALLQQECCPAGKS